MTITPHHQDYILHSRIFHPDALNRMFGDFGASFSLVQRPIGEQDLFSETWTIRIKDESAGPRLEARSRKTPWTDDINQWPLSLREWAKAHLDNKGVARSRRKWREWGQVVSRAAQYGIDCVKRAARVLTVVLTVLRRAPRIMKTVIEARFEDARGFVRVFVDTNPSQDARVSFYQWMTQRLT